MPTPDEKNQAQRNAVALMLHAVRSEDRGAELLAQISHLDLVPVVMILAEVAVRRVVVEHGSEDIAVQLLERHLIDLAGDAS